MSNQQKNKMLTYGEWEVLHRRQVKRYFRRKFNDFLYGVVLFFILVVPLFVLLAHYFLTSY